MANMEEMIESACLTADVSGIFRENAGEHGKALPSPEAIAKSALLIHKRRTDILSSED